MKNATPPLEQRKCKNTNNKTFVDDNILKITQNGKPHMKTAIQEAMLLIEDYTAANKLKLNPDKTSIMLITNKKTETEIYSQ